MATQHHWIGLKLSHNRYTVTRKLGEGGMGFVFAAHDENLGTDVVIKIPRPELFGNNGDIARRFEAEIRSLVRLSHPHIVKIMDTGSYEGTPFAVMQYLAGGSLEDRIGAKAPRPTSGDWLLEVAKALDYIHAEGCIHRDVKPANILFDETGNAHLGDFGIAKATSEATKLTPTGGFIGTPSYMAPELCLGEQLDGRVDQYALAVVLYETLSGKTPFEGSSPAAILVNQVQLQPRPLHEVASAVPVALSEVVGRAMAKKAVDRFGSCLEFAAAARKSLARRSPAPPVPEAVATAPSAPPMPLGSPADQVPDRGVVPRPLIASPDTARSGDTAGRVPAARPVASAQRVRPATGRGGELRGTAVQFAQRYPLPLAFTACGLIFFSWLAFALTRGGGYSGPDPELEPGLVGLPAVSVDPPSSHDVVPPTDPSPSHGPPEPVDRPSTTLSPTITNSVKMTLRLIPAGEFLMGSPASEAGRDDDERQHRVRITRPFYMGTTEVTQGQWASVMKTTPWKGRTLVKEGRDYSATYISWEDANEFCTRLSSQDGRAYRLPTEAEWEYACRAGSTTAYSFGDTATSLGDHAWFDENASAVDEHYAHEVGQKRKNAFGLFDMHGNVWEWCSDWYDDEYYKGRPAIDIDPKGPLVVGSYRVLRGGSWSISAQSCRSAVRFEYTPTLRFSLLGFRVCSSVMSGE